jgi:hypothetical protein
MNLTVSPSPDVDPSYLAIISLLLRHGADPNAPDQAGVTPPHAAAALPVKAAPNKPAGRTSCMLSRRRRPQSSYPSEGAAVVVPAVLAPTVRTILITTSAGDYRITPDRLGPFRGGVTTCGSVREVSEGATGQLADMAHRQSGAVLAHWLPRGSTDHRTSHSGPIVPPLHAHAHPGQSPSCANSPAVGAHGEDR